jgi:uncharacterized protein (DUF1697 family)
MRDAASSVEDKPFTRVAVLLRGINVGGRHPVPMAALRECFAGLGCRDVATYIQSGNLVCTAPRALTEAAISIALAERLGFAIPVALRGQQEFIAAVSGNPFIQNAANDAGNLHVVFLEQPLSAEVLAGLAAKCAGEERLVALGRELFLDLPHGVGRSKLALACTAAGMPGNPSMRNWKTVLQLAQMLSLPDPIS